MCRSREQDFMVSRGTQFIDGTRCELDGSVTPGAVSACLNGECKVTTGMLGSESTVINSVLISKTHQ